MLRYFISFASAALTCVALVLPAEGQLSQRERSLWGGTQSSRQSPTAGREGFFEPGNRVRDQHRLWTNEPGERAMRGGMALYDSLPPHIKDELARAAIACGVCAPRGGLLGCAECAAGILALDAFDAPKKRFSDQSQRQQAIDQNQRELTKAQPEPKDSTGPARDPDRPGWTRDPDGFWRSPPGDWVAPGNRDLDYRHPDFGKSRDPFECPREDRSTAIG